MDNKDWLFDKIDGLKEKIRFKDRIEYRLSGEIHNHVGAAIVYLPNEHGEKDDDCYYLHGVEYSYEDWNIKTRGTKISKLKKKME